MQPNDMLKMVRQFFALLSTGTIYTFACLGCGAVFGLVAVWLDRNPYPSALFGLFLPLPPLYFWFSSDGAIRRRLIRLKAMADQKLMTQAQFRRLRHELLNWYIQRQFGGTGLEMPADDSDEHPPKSPPTPATP